MYDGWTHTVIWFLVFYRGPRTTQLTLYPPLPHTISMQSNHSTACPLIDSLDLDLTHHVLTHPLLWTWFSLFTLKLSFIALLSMWTLGTWTAFLSQLGAGSLSYLNRLLFSPILKPSELCCSCFNLHSFYNPYTWHTGIYRYLYSVLLYDVWSRIFILIIKTEDLTCL